MSRPFATDDLSAFIDGQLPPERAASLAEAMRADPALAAREAALRRDRDLFAQAYAPLASQPIPAAWRARIEQAVSSNVVPIRPPARRVSPPVRWAAAACLALAIATASWLQPFGPSRNGIVQEAAAARNGRLAALTMLAGTALPGAEQQRALLKGATGLPIRAPDLRRLGWRLATLATYRDAAELRYANAAGAALTVYVRRSMGAPRFDLLRDGKLRVCVWQDEVVGAVIIGEMPAGQMMRVAGAAYSDLDL